MAWPWHGRWSSGRPPIAPWRCRRTAAAGSVAGRVVGVAGRSSGRLRSRRGGVVGPRLRRALQRRRCRRRRRALRGPGSAAGRSVAGRSVAGRSVAGRSVAGRIGLSAASGCRAVCGSRPWPDSPAGSSDGLIRPGSRAGLSAGSWPWPLVLRAARSRPWQRRRIAVPGRVAGRIGLATASAVGGSGCRAVGGSGRRPGHGDGRWLFGRPVTALLAPSDRGAGVVSTLVDGPAGLRRLVAAAGRSGGRRVTAMAARVSFGPSGRGHGSAAEAGP
jgi:hypothetical protein